jgi:hypothetical protein
VGERDLSEPAAAGFEPATFGLTDAARAEAPRTRVTFAQFGTAAGTSGRRQSVAITAAAALQGAPISGATSTSGRNGSRLFPQAGGFEGLFAGREEAEAHHLRALRVPDAEEVAFGPDPAALTGSRLSEDE